jgi:hypothetical protein
MKKKNNYKILLFVIIIILIILVIFTNIYKIENFLTSNTNRSISSKLITGEVLYSTIDKKIPDEYQCEKVYNNKTDCNNDKPKCYWEIIKNKCITSCLNYNINTTVQNRIALCNLNKYCKIDDSLCQLKEPVKDKK